MAVSRITKAAHSKAHSTKRRTVAANGSGPAPIDLPELSATNLKSALWETLNAVKNNTMQPGHGDAIACQAREILRTIKVQLQIVGQAKRQVPTDIVGFAETPLPANRLR